MKFQHILVDYPWWYANRLTGTGRTKFGSGAPGKYPCEKPEAAYEMPVADVAGDPCMIHFWVTGPHLFDAKIILDAWGFTYTTIEFTWFKTVKWTEALRRITNPWDGYTVKDMISSLFRRSPGHYTASNAELVLLGWKGSPILPEVKMEPQIIVAPITTHSRKPFDVHSYIDRAYPGSNCLELFACPPVWTDGHLSANRWRYLGFDVDGRDIRESLADLANEKGENNEMAT